MPNITNSSLNPVDPILTNNRPKNGQEISLNGRSFSRKVVDLLCAATVAASVSGLVYSLLQNAPSKPKMNHFNNDNNGIDTNLDLFHQNFTEQPTSPIDDLVFGILRITPTATIWAKPTTTTNLIQNSTDENNKNSLQQSSAQISPTDFSILNLLALADLNPFISTELVNSEATTTHLATIGSQATGLATLLSQSTETALANLSPAQIQLIEQFAVSLGIDPTTSNNMETAIAIIGNELTQLSLGNTNTPNKPDAQCPAYFSSLADLSISQLTRLPELVKFVSTALVSLQTTATDLVAMNNPTTSLAAMLNKGKKIPLTALTSGQLQLIEKLTVNLGMNPKNPSDMGTALALVEKRLPQLGLSCTNEVSAITPENLNPTLPPQSFSRVVALALLAMDQDSSKKDPT